jgi:phage baseplate assembly protein W
MELANQFIGGALVFPIELNSLGGVTATTGAEVIKNSIRIILGWPSSQRFFLGAFGSKLEMLLQEPNDNIVKGLLKTVTIEALRLWEKRVEVKDSMVVNIEADRIDILLSYRIKATQEEDSFIWPFYKTIKQ